MMKVGVSAYSFSQYIRQGKMTVMDCPAKAKEMGFECIEFTDLIPPEGKTVEEFAYEVKAECDRVGIPVSNYSVGADFQNRDIDEEVARLKKCVDVAAILGATGMRHDATFGAKPGAPFEAFALVMDRIAAGIREVSEYAATKGIKTMSENHGRFAQDALRVEALINKVNCPNYGWLVDMGNFTCADEDPAISVGIAAPYAMYVHAKDFLIRPASSSNPGRYFMKSRNGSYLRGTIVGQGNVPVKHCLAALRNAGYDGYVSIEFEGMEDCILALEAGRENLVRYINEIEDIPLK